MRVRRDLVVDVAGVAGVLLVAAALATVSVGLLLAWLGLVCLAVWAVGAGAWPPAR